MTLLPKRLVTTELPIEYTPRPLNVMQASVMYLINSFEGSSETLVNVSCGITVPEAVSSVLDAHSRGEAAYACLMIVSVQARDSMTKYLS